MSLEKKYNSIDQSKLKPAVRDILKKMKEKSENFTNSDINKKVEPALDKLLMRLEKELPEAIKKATKTPSKPKAKPKAKAKAKPKTKSTKETFTQKASKLMKKEGISWAEAKNKLSKQLKDEKDKVEKDIKSDNKQALNELDKLIKSTEFKKDLGKFPKKSSGEERELTSDISADGKRQALPRGKRKSKNGKTYYEYRDNRSDVNSLPAPKGQYRYKGKTPPYLEAGGDVYDFRPSKEMIEKEIKQLQMDRPNALTDLERFRIDKKIRQNKEILKHRKSKMEAGGTLPTPFGQAGLVGETGTMNEVDLFAMGGGLPQGVHQYYGQTYNPAYPTPHGYAKGGMVSVDSKNIKDIHKKYKNVSQLENGQTYAIIDGQNFNIFKDDKLKVSNNRVVGIKKPSYITGKMAKGGKTDDFNIEYLKTLKGESAIKNHLNSLSNEDIKRFNTIHNVNNYKGGIRTIMSIIIDKDIQKNKDILDMYAKGGDIPVGFHKMPNGEIMADSEHLAEGGETIDGFTLNTIKGVANKPTNVDIDKLDINYEKGGKVSYDPLRKVKEAIEKGGLNLDKGSRQWRGLYLDITPLYWDRNNQNGFDISVFDEEYGRHLGDVDVDYDLDKITTKSRFEKGGEVDLFEDYEKQPKELSEIVEKYQERYADGDMDYESTKEFLGKVNAIGYTFDSGLDNEPFGLRKMSKGGFTEKDTVLIQKHPSGFYVVYLFNDKYSDNTDYGTSFMERFETLKEAKSFANKTAKENNASIKMAKGGKTKRSKHSLMQDRRRVSSEPWEVAYQKRKAKMEKGGTTKQGYDYVPQEAIDELSYTMGKVSKSVSGSNVLSGAYVKSGSKAKTKSKGANDLTKRLLAMTDDEDKTKVILEKDVKEMQKYVSDKLIIAFYLGLPKAYDFKGDYSYGGGVINYDLNRLKKRVADTLKNIKGNKFEMGLKYPQYDFEKLLGKPTIKDVFGKTTTFDDGSTERYKYRLWIWKDCVIGQTIGSESSRRGGYTDYTYGEEPTLIGGYKSVQTSKASKLESIAKFMADDKNGFVKDNDVLYNGLGGTTFETLDKNKIKYQAGGTLPTPFGQAGLVGETGAMNEMDMFAMGGGLPQGVHQYYANTYNPAYPTPHGYAKGGKIDTSKKGVYLMELKDGTFKVSNNLGDRDFPYEFNDVFPTKERAMKFANRVAKNSKSKVVELKFAKGGTLYGDGKMYKYTKDGVVKEVRDINRKLLKEITNKGKKYRRNSTYKTYNSVEGNELLNQSDIGNKMAKGGKTQGYNDKLDESLGNTKGKRSTKEQNYKDRRNESEAMEKKGGKRKYSSVKTMDKGNRSKRRTPMSLAKEIRKEGENWQQAVKRASAILKKKYADK